MVGSGRSRTLVAGLRSMLVVERGVGRVVEVGSTIMSCSFMLSCFFCGICIIICRVGAAVGVLSFSFDPVGEQRRLSSTFSYVLLCFAVVLAWR